MLQGRFDHDQIGCLHRLPDDLDACTTDGCDAITGCTTTPIVCDDLDACTTDGCDAITGCEYTPIAVCDDNDACTSDKAGAAVCKDHARQLVLRLNKKKKKKKPEKKSGR